MADKVMSIRNNSTESIQYFLTKIQWQFIFFRALAKTKIAFLPDIEKRITVNGNLLEQI